MSSMSKRPSPPAPRPRTEEARTIAPSVGDGALLSKGLRIWEEETARFLDEMIRQDQATFERLCQCKSPLEVLSVEQEWVRARSRAYLESGLRFAEAFSAVSRATDGETEPPEARPLRSAPAAHGRSPERRT